MPPTTTQSARAAAALAAFHGSDLASSLSLHHTQSPVERALSLFHAAAERVPAYARFLAEHGVDAERVTTAAAFEELPTPTKDSYYRRHSLPDLCWDGRLER